jgi:hypothetical protein
MNKFGGYRLGKVEKRRQTIKNPDLRKGCWGWG